jgi:hypothetical protein
MTVVAMPDGTQVAFPDGMPPDQIRSMILQKFPDAGKPAAPQPSLMDAVTDIPKEIGNAAGEAWQNIKGIANRGEKGPIEGLIATGKAVLGVPQLAMSPITGAARSLIGHPMAQAEHAVGTLIAPEIAAKDDPQKMYETAKGDVDLAMSAAGAKRTLPAKAHVPSIDELKRAYTNVRNSPEVAGANVPIEDVRALSAQAQQDLLREGFRPTTASAESTFGELKNLSPKEAPAPTPAQRLQAEMNWESPPSPPKVVDATVDDIMAARRAFGQTAQQKNPFPIGGSTPDAAAAQRVMRKIDELIEQHVPEMRAANANYSGAKTAEAIDARINKAELGAAANNSGMNIGNKIRQQAVQILTNPAARRGLRADEIGMLEDLVKGNLGNNSVRWWSNLLGGGGGMGAEVTGAVASHGLGPVGWALAPLGKVFKHIENHLTVKQANKISEAIRARTPLGNAYQASADKWNEAQLAFSAGPSARSYASLSIASRNLANTLSTAGVKIDPAQLMRSIQGPVPARAEGEQQ